MATECCQSALAPRHLLAIASCRARSLSVSFNEHSVRVSYTLQAFDPLECQEHTASASCPDRTSLQPNCGRARTGAAQGLRSIHYAD